MDLRSFIREMPGKGRCDVSPLLRNADAFTSLIRCLYEPFTHSSVTHVVGIDAMGFILGGPVAIALEAGFVPVRKSGKAAWSTTCRVLHDYSGGKKSLHLVTDALDSSFRVILIDDWTETGAQLEAAAELCRTTGATILGAAVINADQPARHRLEQCGLRLYAAVCYEGS